MSTTEQAVDELLNEPDWTGKIYSDGWVDAPETIETIEPATGEVLGTAGVANGASVAAAAKSAAHAQREWAVLPMTERVAVMRRAGELLERHRAEIAGWMIRESGCIPPKAMVEITASIGQLDQAASLISHPLGHVLPSLTPGRTSTARRVPVGVVGVITPWNFPIVLAMRSIGPALALGNAVVLKSDPNTPVSGGVIIARLFEEAGLPEGVLHVLGGGAEVGQALVEDPNIRMISFTGSTKTGRIVGEAAGRGLKRIVLELGGNCPLIVLDDADIEAASSAGAWGSFLHQGQICIAVSRHLVHESIAEKYLAALAERAGRLTVGNPATTEVALGPIINQKQVERVQRIVDETVRAGASALVGGTHDGPFFPATVLRDVLPGMAAFNEEIFGPVAPVTTFKTDAEAVELANATEYGLAAAVQSGSQSRAADLAEGLNAGMVHINDQTVNEEPPAPFGGFKSSSNGGHFGGVSQLELWTEWQWLTSTEKAHPFPF
ncbi:MAG TPA: benzaldehyde dehydrogenase [Gaiellaceae bacterium]|nr:benzaldehyde dehydrogenase [Gaiellaceae bacterium]